MDHGRVAGRYSMASAYGSEMTTTQIADGIDIMCADSMDAMPDIADNSVDLIVTDPPYFKYKDQPWDWQWDTHNEFLTWLDGVLAQFYRILKPNGSLYLFASNRLSARIEVLVGTRFNVLNRITWFKGGRGRWLRTNKESLRSYFPHKEEIIFAEHYGADNIAKGEAGYGRKCDELRGIVFEPLRAYLAGERDRAGLTNRRVAEEFQKKTGSRTLTGMPHHWFDKVQWEIPTERSYLLLREIFSTLNHGGEYLRREYEDLRRQYEDLRRQYEDLRRPFNATPDVPYTDVWTFETVSHYNGKHPCEKPVDMMLHIVKISSRLGGLVFDPFMGSGSTGVAALRTGRRFLGIEREESYFKSARNRLMRERDTLWLCDTMGAK